MSLLDALRHRTYALLHPERYEDERAEELLFHARMEAWDRARPGQSRQSPAETDPHTNRHPERRVRLAILDWLRQDLAYALRGIRRSPGFAAVVVVTLALGVGANAAVFSLLDRMFGQPPAGVSQPDELRRLYIQDSERRTDAGNPYIATSASWPMLSSIDRRVQGVANLIAWTSPSEGTLGDDPGAPTLHSSHVTHDYFQVLGVGPAMGRVFGLPEEPVDVPGRSAVISHDFWRRGFGSDPRVVGRTLELDDVVYQIVGVAAEGFSGLSLTRTDVFLPVSTLTGQSPEGVDVPFYGGSGSFFTTAVRLAPGASDTQLTERATSALNHYLDDYPELRVGDAHRTALVVPGSIIAAQGPNERTGEMTVSLRIAGVAVMVLIVACANVTTLLLVRGARRRREVAVRLALGVSRGRLFAQAAVEGVLLAVLGAAAAAFVAAWGGDALRTLLFPTIVWAAPSLDGRTTLFIALAGSLVAVVTALGPALQARRTDVTATIKRDSRGGGTRTSGVQALLLVAQGGLSVVLLIGSALFIRSLGKIGELPLGYDLERIGTVRLPSGVANAFDVLSEAAQAVAGLPGVSGAAVSGQAPMLGTNLPRLALANGDTVPRLGERTYSSLQVAPGFFEAVDLDVIEGRAFTAAEPTGVLVVNQTMAKLYWPGQDPLGQCLRVGGVDAECSTVIGVVENARAREIIEDPTVLFYVPLEAPRARALVIGVSERDWPPVAEALRASLARHTDVGAVRFTHLTEVFTDQLGTWRLGAQLFTAFGLLALLVTAVGVYSVMAYTVAQRSHEMGVRIALGAKLHDLLRLVVGDGLRSVLLGALIGLALALALGKLVASLLYGVTARDPLSMGAAVLVLLTTGVIATLVPAWRAARVDPVRALVAE